MDKTCIPLALKMPKLTDVDGRACTELGTGRDCHYAAKTGAHRHRQGVLMSDLTAKLNFSCILSAANFFYQNSADIRISRTFCGGFSAVSIIAADRANFRRLRV